MKVKKSVLNVCAVLSLLGCGSAWGADATLGQAGRLLESGKGSEAYVLLESLEPERAGEIEYDLLLGLAALEAGQNTRAVFALERVLAQEPNNARARAEIARAYLALGETKNARREFENVRSMGVPAEVGSTIERFLAAVERLEDEARTQVRGYLELGLGIDSNVNSGTSRGEYAIPFFGGWMFPVGSGAKENGDTFTNVAGGINFRTPLQAGLAVTGGAAFSQRLNSNDTDFDNGSWDANLGLTKAVDKNQYSLALQASTFRLNGERYRDAMGFTGQWQHNYDSRNQASLYLQYASLTYPGQAIRNTDRFVVGGAYAHAFREGQVIYGGAYVGTEMEKNELATFMGHDLVGVRIGGQMDLAPRWVGFANANLEQRRYHGSDPFFLSIRQDLQANINVGANFSPSREWHITPQFSYTRNDSNLTLNDYHRQVVSVTVRRDF
ncbi:MAG: DUF560 domain-containing protein [Betaproteobacteria bacterium]|nr:MAG: DUF560 domain-containing protein [Betaproteobacteria bacterium]